jgi:hypothetical protein
MKPSQQSLFALAILMLLGGFVLTVANWKGKEALSIAGSIGVLWFHFSAHFGLRGTKWKAWPQHLLIVSFICANLLRGFDVAFAPVFFILVIVAVLANILVSGMVLLPKETSVNKDSEEDYFSKKSE